MDLGEKISNYRKQSNLSQDDLAEKLGVARQTISKWETNVTTPDFNQVKKMCDIFKVGISEFDEFDNKRIMENKERKDYYEYKSNKSIFGYPLIHINISLGKMRMRKARGIIAIGDSSKGIISLGFFSLGLFSFGLISVGLCSIGLLSLAMFLSIGVLSIGLIAIGVIAIGFLAIGAVAIGIYSVGAVAIANKIAYGDYATGYIAIGNRVIGTHEVLNYKLTKEQIELLIKTELPNTIKNIIDLFANLVKLK